jgi:hypothetical protein
MLMSRHLHQKYQSECHWAIAKRLIYQAFLRAQFEPHTSCAVYNIVALPPCISYRSA